MDIETAKVIAQSTMRNFLCSGYTEHGFKHRYREGRWDVYSVDVGQWHILVSDNGGKIVYCGGCSQ